MEEEEEMEDGRGETTCDKWAPETPFVQVQTLLIKGASTCRVLAGGKGEALCPMTPTLVQQTCV